MFILGFCVGFEIKDKVFIMIFRDKVVLYNNMIFKDIR